VRHEPPAPQGREELGRSPHLLGEALRLGVDLPHLRRVPALRGHERRPQRDEHGQLLLVALPPGRELSNELERLAQMLDGFQICRTLRGAPPGPEPVRDRSLVRAGFGEVMRHGLRLALGQIRETAFEGLGNLEVVLPTGGVEQRMVRRLLDEGVPEVVRGARWMRPLGDELAGGQLPEGVPARGLRHGHDHRQQLVIELPPDDAGGLGDFLRPAEPVETAHERIAQRRGNRVPGRLPRRDGRLGLDRRLGDLLHVQRVAGRALRDLLDQRLREGPPTRHLGDEIRRLAPAQLIEGQGRHMREPHPSRRELRPGRDDQQGALLRQEVDEAFEHRARGRVDPVRVLEYGEHRAR
jgi:hypothetical protein